MNVCHFLLEDKPYQVITLRDDNSTPAIDGQPDSLNPVAYQCHVDSYRKPYQRCSYHWDDAGEAGQETGEQDVGSTENPVAYHGYSSLYDGE